MKQKTFLFILFLCVLIPVVTFSSYQFGYNSANAGYEKGLMDGYANTETHSQSKSYEGGYLAGYQAGLQASQNATIP
jgi:hypothetical protein